MVKLSQEEVNALLVICANAPIKGQDSKFMVQLMEKLEIMLKEESIPDAIHA